MKKIVFGITSLTLGGAERVLVDIANRLKKEYEITIFTLYAKGQFAKQLDSNINIESIYSCCFDEMSKFKKAIISLKLLFFKRKIYNRYIKGKYDIEIAFLEGPITRLFSVRNSRVKKVTWVHNDISQVFGKSLKAKIKQYYDKLQYDKYQKIIFVSNDNMEKFKNVYQEIDEKKFGIISNYINVEDVIKKAKEEVDIKYNLDEYNIVTVARLVEQKAIDRLIDVHTRLIKDGYNHHIYIIGDGPKKQELEKKISENGVGNTCTLLGKKENPYPYVKQANIFCLMSYYEGYGMVLEEAKILGKYIVITNTAAREALKGYDNIKIVENSENEIYLGLKECIKNSVGANCVHLQVEEFEKIIEEIKEVVL